MYLGTCFDKRTLLMVLSRHILRTWSQTSDSRQGSRFTFTQLFHKGARGRVSVVAVSPYGQNNFLENVIAKLLVRNRDKRGLPACAYVLYVMYACMCVSV